MSFLSVQSRALSCLSNIILGFPVSSLGDTNGLNVALLQICEKAFAGVGDDELQECALFALHSLWTVANSQINAQADHLRFVAGLCRHSSPQVRAAAIGTLSKMGLTQIGRSLMGDLAPRFVEGLEDESLWVVVESLNSVFELFDDHHDDIVANLSIPKRLEQLIPFLEQKISQVLWLS